MSVSLLDIVLLCVAIGLTIVLVIKILPNFHTIFQSGITFYAHQQYDDALKKFMRAVKMSPHNYNACCNLGLTYFKLGQNDQAINYLEMAVELNPDDPDIYHNIGVIYESLERLEDAIGMYLSAIHHDPQNAESYYGASKCYEQLDDIENALEYIGKAVDLNPDDPEYCFFNGLLKSYVGEFDDAIKDIKLAIELDPLNWNFLYELSIVYAKQEQWDPAIATCLKAIEIEEHNPKLYNQIGLSYYCTDKIRLAIDSYKKAIEIDPNYSIAYLNYGYALEKNKDYPNAIRMLEQYLSLNPETEDSEDIHHHIHELKSYNHKDDELSHRDVENQLSEALETVSKDTDESFLEQPSSMDKSINLAQHVEEENDEDVVASDTTYDLEEDPLTRLGESLLSTEDEGNPLTKQLLDYSEDTRHEKLPLPITEESLSQEKDGFIHREEVISLHSIQTLDATQSKPPDINVADKDIITHSGERNSPLKELHSPFDFENTNQFENLTDYQSSS